MSYAKSSDYDSFLSGSGLNGVFANALSVPFGFTDRSGFPNGTNGSRTEGKQDGFDLKFTIPFSVGGQRLTYQQLNRAATIATIGTCLDAHGYPYGNVPLIGREGFPGYAKGAIVSVFDETTKRVYDWISVVDNNNNLYPWECPYSEMSDTPIPDTGWLPISRVRTYEFPDIESRETIYEDTFSQGVSSFEVTCEIPRWAYVTRTISGNYDMSDFTTMMEKGPSVSFLAEPNGIYMKNGTLNFPDTSLAQREVGMLQNRIEAGEGYVASRIVFLTNKLSGQVVVPETETDLSVSVKVEIFSKSIAT